MALINILKKSLNRILRLKQKISSRSRSTDGNVCRYTTKLLAEMIAQNREKFMFPIRETHD